MALRDLAYYKGKIQTLRSALDDLLREMEAEAEPAPAPRKRRNLKEARVLEFSHNGWKNNRAKRISK